MKNASEADMVTVTRDGAVGVITVNNPPVNALAHLVRDGLAREIMSLRDDKAISSIVIACAGRTFFAGADITEFGQPPVTPSLREIILLIESADKPVIAAIHGTALGGGFELALACHYRVALDSAILGLPEVKLGLIPGAGGTIRLTYLAGYRVALQVATGARTIGSSEAVDLGIVDRLVDNNLLAEAIIFARQKGEGRSSLYTVRERAFRATGEDMAAFETDALKLLKRSRGLDAPVACVEAIRNALSLSFEDALRAEQLLFERLVAGEQSRAQRHLFFAERNAAKVDGLSKAVNVRKVSTVGVVGAGTMGAGIAMAFANAGIPVTIADISPEQLQRGMSSIERNYSVSVSRGSLSRAQKLERIARITPTSDLERLQNSDLIIEAVFEDLATKQNVFRQIDPIARHGAILATNSSYLSVDQLTEGAKRPEDALGLHFFSPANVMKLVEIVRGRKTSDEALATALSVAKAIGKIPVVVGSSHGFVGNRMLAARSSDLQNLLLEGAAPLDIDAVFLDFGWSMGPFQMSDLAGLDVGWRNRKALGTTAVIADALCELGRFGQKTGRGYYLYDNESRFPFPDPELEELIARKAGEQRIQRRQISAEEVLERTLFPMINEGLKILAEGVASRQSDIDVVWVHGYGFPRAKGGPMYWAELEGLDKIASRLDHWFEKTGNEVFKRAEHLRAEDLSA